MGFYISYRVFDIADITVDGSITLGAAICAVLIVKRTAILCLPRSAGFAGGLAAGTVTGVLQARFKINSLLAGILVMTGLYSVNLHIMGKSNVPLLSGDSLITRGRRGLGPAWFGRPEINVFGWLVSTRDLVDVAVVLALILAGLPGAVLVLPHRTGHRHARCRRQSANDSRAGR